ncbi:MAG: cell division protein FtsL [Gammaproteobacteria bacterium]|jgi:cell division protein FtsL|tara:strand:- start:76 stop:351 length:276 start_codon:yes stop_codon:yes gene_type:complete
MTHSMQLYFLLILAFLLLCICLDTVKIRWQIAQEFENQEYLKVSQNKLSEINIQLQTEHHHLNSPARIERHAKEVLGMVEIIQKLETGHEK